MVGHHHLALALLPAVTVLGLVVSWTDIRSRRIPNVVLMIALAYAVVAYAMYAWFAGWGPGLRALGFALLGMLIGFGLLYPGYAIRQVGAGDVKLMMVFGFFLGPIGGVLALFTGALVGSAWALVLSWRHGGLRQVFTNLRNMARAAYVSGFRELSWDLRSAGAVKMPYGVALSVGAIAVAAWQLALRLP